MEIVHQVPIPRIHFPNPRLPFTTSKSISRISVSETHLNSPLRSKFNFSYGKSDNVNVRIDEEEAKIRPTMFEILESSRAQNLDLELQKLGPFFRITAKSMESQREVGRAEGLIRVWFKGRILHLDSIRLRRETLGMEKSIFGIGLFIGAVAIRHGYDCGCKTAELLAINDADLYHAKLVRFYKRLGFRVVHEVSGSSIRDVGHMLVWGGVGTRMDANVEDLLFKWCTRTMIQFTRPLINIIFCDGLLPMSGFNSFTRWKAQVQGEKDQQQVHALRKTWSVENLIDARERQR